MLCRSFANVIGLDLTVTASARRCGCFAMVIITMACGSVIPGNTACGEEPFAEFLEALRSRGYYDVALPYLDRMASATTVSEVRRQTIAYERGVTLVSAALKQRQMAGKERYLDQAQAAFERFRQDAPNHSLALSSNGQLGNILVERARIKLLRAARPLVQPEQQEILKQEARSILDQAGKIFNENRDSIRVRLEDMPKALDPDKDSDRIAERDRLRAEYVQAQFVAAMIQYERAQTYDPSTAEFRKGMERSGKLFGVVAQKYRRRLAGLSAVLFQGRCRQALSDPKGALSYYEDLLTLPEGEPVLRPLQTKALRSAIECWLDEQVNQKKLAIKRAEEWIQQQRPNERGDADWLAIKLRLAQAYREQSKDERGRTRTAMVADARRLAVDVAKQNSEFQTAAQEMLTSFGIPNQTPKQSEEVDNFAAALAAAKEAVSQRKVASSAITLLQGRLPQVSDPESRKEIESRLADAEKQLKEAESQALALFDRARLLADQDVSVEDMNTVRYYLCTLYYYQGDHLSAAVLGDFLARRFPATAEGRRAASVALASLVKMYGEGKGPNAEQLADRIKEMADYIATRWQGQPDAAEALSTLVTLAVNTGRPADAQEYLKMIPEDSDKRGQAELSTGQAIWNQNVGVAQPDADLQQQAIDLLTSGLKKTADLPVTPQRVAAALSLAQYHLNHDNAALALSLLEDRHVGPKTLADKNHPAISSAALLRRTYTLAILAYVASIPEADDTDATVAKALAALDALKQQLGEDPAGKRRLSTIYVSLARNLQKQIDEASPAAKKTVSAAFQQFLDRAASTTTDLAVLNWIADSYVGLGLGFADELGRVTGEGQAFFARAISIYDSILKQANSGQLQLPDVEILRTQSRLAVAYREMGEYAQAIDVLARVLQRQETQVYIQMEAARTFHQWGDRSDANAYLKAIRGDRQKSGTNKNLIWGYGRIANIVARSPKLRALFHEARLGVAKCRYQYALRQSKTQRAKELAQAEQDILVTARLYGLGDDATKTQYEELLGQIQRAQGKRATGIK